MAHEFIGCSVLVKLSSPAGEQVRGTVTQIEGQKLFLKNAHLLQFNIKNPFVVVEGHDIADIEVLPTLPPISASRHTSIGSLANVEDVKSLSSRPPLATITPSTTSPHYASQTFTSIIEQNAAAITAQEPKRPLSGHGAKPRSSENSSEVASNSKASKASLTDPAILSIEKAHANGTNQHQSVSPSQPVSLVSATLSEPFHSLSLSDIPVYQQVAPGTVSPPEAQGSPQDGLNGQQESKKRRRRKRKKPGVEDKETSLPQGSTRPKFGPAIKANPATLKKRNSALEKELASEDSNDEYQPRRPSNTKVPKRQRPSRHRRVTSEWEAEDTSNLHQLPEFDFAANLSKFDKHSLFSRFKNDDTTADEARLVGHNRLARPGTNGGKNLHFTENVLNTSQLPPIPGKWSSEAGESELEGILEARTRTYSHRSINSKLASSRPTSSTRRDFEQPRSAASIRSITRSLSSRPQSTTRTRPRDTRGPLHLTPLQAVEAEAFAVSDLGLWEDIMTENAARGIAEVIVRDLKDRPTAIEHPHVIIFAGNHKTGARAIAAGRHLANRGIEVTATVFDAREIRRAESFLPAVKQANFAFKMAGGKLRPMQTLVQALNSLELEAHILLDAVFGIHLQCSDLSPAALQSANALLDLFQHPGRQEHMLCVDVPLGRDARTGQVDSPLGQGMTSLRWPRHVIFLGAPKTWRETYFGKEEDGMKRIMSSEAFRSWVVDLGFDFERAKGGIGSGQANWAKPWVEELLDGVKG